MSSAQNSLATIERFIQQVGAAEKRAEEVGSSAAGNDNTTHPVMKADDGTQATTTGARAAENKADVKADQGAPSVENTPTDVAAKKAFDLSRFARSKKADEGKSSDGGVSTPGSAADDQLQIGTKKAPTGDAPDVETSSTKRDKDNPETSHPTGGDIPQDGPQGGKTAFDAGKLDELTLQDLAKMASDLGNSICAQLAAGDTDDPAPAPTTKQAGLSETELAQQAGWELAGFAAGQALDKQAVDAAVQETAEQIIKTAQDDAFNVITYYQAVAEGYRQKQAEGFDPTQAGPGGGIPMGGGEGGPEGGAPGGGDEQLMAALAGGQGGAPEGGAPGGGAPEEGGAEGGGDEVEQLAQLLEQLGITPEELEAAMAQGDLGGGGEGGAGGEGGEEPPPAEPKTAAAKPAVKAAAAKRGNAAGEVLDVIKEVVARSRRK